MSIEISKKVWARSRSTGTTRLVLLALADFAEDSGTCFPSIATLSKMANMSERTVQYSLRELKSLGEISIHPHPRHYGSNIYTVLPMGEAECTGGCNGLHPKGATGCTPGVQPSAPDPSIDPCSRESSGGFAESPDWAEVEIFADKIGLAKWKARDWFLEMEGCGWLDYQHRPVTKWQAVLTRVKVKWEADGRPAAPPTARGYGSNTGAKAPSWAELKCRLEAVEKRLQELRNKGSQTATGTIYPPGILEEIKKLKTTRGELLRKLTSE